MLNHTFSHSTNEIIRIHHKVAIWFIWGEFSFFPSFLSLFAFCCSGGILCACVYVLCGSFRIDWVCSWNFICNAHHWQSSTVNLSFNFTLYHFLTWESQKKERSLCNAPPQRLYMMIHKMDMVNFSSERMMKIVQTYKLNWIACSPIVLWKCAILFYTFLLLAVFCIFIEFIQCSFSNTNDNDKRF